MKGHATRGKEENNEERKYEELRMPLDDDDKLSTEVTIDGNKITPPNNYLIGKITQVDNGMLVEFVKKKPKYPETFVECCNVLGILYKESTEVGYSFKLMRKFHRLLICRDAYWKIAGEEMGLSKPWEPDWSDTNVLKHCIYYVGNKIKKQPILEAHLLLAFPTSEMQDAFYENFKDLIETCKELL